MDKRNHGTRQPKPRGPASLQDVLGRLVPRRRVHHRWAEHHRTLLRLRERFALEMRSRSQHAKQPLPTSGEHMADSASDSYERDWALAMASSEQDALYEIDQALARIANGTYGVCELTGKAIEAARLRTIPWTRFSAKAQADLEARGMSGRTQLGALGTYSSAGEDGKADADEAEEGAADEKAAA